MIARASQSPDALLENSRGSGRQVGQRSRGGIPKGEQSLRRNGLPQANHALAIRKRKNFHGAIENHIRNGHETRQRVAILNGERGGIDGDNFVEGGANPNRSAVGG